MTNITTTLATEEGRLGRWSDAPGGVGTGGGEFEVYGPTDHAGLLRAAGRCGSRATWMPQSGHQEEVLPHAVGVVRLHEAVTVVCGDAAEDGWNDVNEAQSERTYCQIEANLLGAMVEGRCDLTLGVMAVQSCCRIRDAGAQRTEALPQRAYGGPLRRACTGPVVNRGRARNVEDNLLCEAAEEMDVASLVQRLGQTPAGRTGAEPEMIAGTAGRGRPTLASLDANIRERSRRVGNSLARIIPAPPDLRVALGHEVVRTALTRLRSQARRTLVTGIALRECIARMDGAASHAISGPATTHGIFVNAVVGEHTARLESIGAAAGARTSGPGYMASHPNRGVR